MAELTILPTWAANHIRNYLLDHVHVINALPVRGGYLLNTSQGAVLLERRRGREPRHWFIPLPMQHTSLTCTKCQERMEFIQRDLPCTVYCTHCGTKHQLGGAPAPEPEEVQFEEAKPALLTVDGVVESASGPYKHGDYTLHARETATRGGSTTFYFFAKNKPKSGEPCAMPEGYDVHINARTKLPYLKRSGSKPKASAKEQCGAFTEDGKQCRLTARDKSAYCHIHKNYRPIGRDDVIARLDSKPLAAKAKDTLPGEGDRGAAENQCAAITAAGSQCRIRSRKGSKYCTRHKGYRPSKALAATDTKPVGKHVKDTKPRVRK